MKNKQGGNTCQGLNSQELELSTKPWFERVDYFHSMPLKIFVHLFEKFVSLLKISVKIIFKAYF